ncbi:hypothetical protein WJX72_002756 [[Myrmecia] bisecta]|uniref:Uncharacterized protein n=1 Tax=[Myrmecia] bisecta TaxID=41462 RepID=A0AAW1PFZ3_9CHLO
MFRRRLAQLLLRGHQGFTRSKGEPANFAAATQQTRQQYNVPSEYQHFRSRGGYRQGPQGSRRGVFWLTTLGGGTAVVVLTHREEIPYTHRKHTVLVSERFVQQLGLAEFERVKAAAELDGSLLPKWHPYTKQITRVGKRIADKASDGHADSGKKNHMQARGHVSAHVYTS